MPDAPTTTTSEPEWDLVPPRPTRPRRLRSVIEWVVILAGALLVAFLVKTFLIQAFYIPSASMEPRLGIGDRVLVNKLSYRLHDVNRGDVVVFERPPCDIVDPVIKDLIKRVIALPGESVEGRNGRVYIDGDPLREPYIAPGVTTADFATVELGPKEYWVMGDNRSNSKDSRVLCGGPTPIEEDLIVGRAFVRVWPLPSISFL